MRRTAITVNYLQMLCLLKVSSSALYNSLLRCTVYFFEELLESLGYCSLRFVCCDVLFTSSKSCLSMLCCLLLLLLRRITWLCGRLALWGRLACGESLGLLGSLGLWGLWLVGRIAWLVGSLGLWGRLAC